MAPTTWASQSAADRASASIAVSIASPDAYVVVAGDTLWRIGQRYDRTVDELLASNRQIRDPALIRVGDKIVIPADDVHALWNATLDLPVLPVPAADVARLMPGCVQGRVAFVDGRLFPRGAERNWWNSTWIDDIVQADVDHDGTTDVVALIKCQPSQGSFERVVAFRPGSDRTFATIGLILQQDWSGGWDPDQIQGIDGIGATSGGEVVVTVWALMCSCDRAVEAPVWQERAYGWDGHAFVQTAGSTTFVVPPGRTDLAIERSMTVGTPVDGIRSGSPAVTIHNRGASAVEDVSVLLWNYDIGLYTRAIGRLDGGASATVTFRDVTSCRSGEECADPFELQVHIGDQIYCHAQGTSCVSE